MNRQLLAGNIMGDRLSAESEHCSHWPVYNPFLGFGSFFWAVAASVLLTLLIGNYCEADDSAARVDQEAHAARCRNLSEKLQAAIAADEQLSGAWLTVDVDSKALESKGGAGYLLRFRTVAEERSEQQLQALDQLVRELVPATQFRYEEATEFRVPYDELTQKLNALIREDIRFPGCKLLGIGYRVNPDDASALELVPRFQVAREGQFDALMDECRRMVNSPAWQGVAVFDGNLAAQQALVPEAAEPELNQLFRNVLLALQHTPELEGAWLDVEIDDQGYPDVAPKIYVFRRGLDGRRKSLQMRAMEKLAAEFIPTGRFRFDVERDQTLPLSDLLDTLRTEVDIDPEFAGCSVFGANYQYNADDESFDLVLTGRVWMPRQADAIAALCRQLMAQSTSWEAAGVQLNTADEGNFTITQGSPEQAAIAYAEAMRYFWKGNYESADEWLSIASIEDPRRLIYRYWRIIGELAVGKQAAAERRLEKTMNGFEVRPYTRAYVDVLRTIYRVQGPLRQRLVAAELKVLAQSVRPGRISGN
jgi:hypothetical protein